jgi:thymidylate kinase
MRKTRRFLRPTGLMVAVLGPDGSGKSSVLSQCSKDLLPAFRRVQVFHLRPRLGGTDSPGSTPNTNPHGQPPRGVITSTAKLAFLWADYTLGYWFKVRPQLVRSTLVLFDRYYHDLLVDPRRYRFASPMWLARWVGHLIPKPDLWLLLDAPPEVLHQRKTEVSFAETARQLKAYRELAGTLPDFTLVDAADSIEEVAMKCNSSVMQRMARRLEPDGVCRRESHFEHRQACL